MLTGVLLLPLPLLLLPLPLLLLQLPLLLLPVVCCMACCIMHACWRLGTCNSLCTRSAVSDTSWWASKSKDVSEAGNTSNTLTDCCGTAVCSTGCTTAEARMRAASTTVASCMAACAPGGAWTACGTHSLAVASAAPIATVVVPSSMGGTREWHWGSDVSGGQC